MKKAVQQNWCDLKLKKVIIEIAPGDHFINCEFDRCTFVGCGEARLTACHFIECSLPRKPRLPLVECKGCTRND